jgi:hypothetical protein
MQARNWAIAAGVVVVLAAILAYAFTRKRPETSPVTDAAQPAVAGEAAPGPAEPPVAQTERPPRPVDLARARWADQLGYEPEWPTDLNAPQDCERVDAELQRLCVYLDSRPELRELADGYGSCDLLRQAAESLAARPPRVSAELRSYETILSNVFHLSRVLGRKPLRYPSRLLADRQELAEPVALAVYRWMVSRERCLPSTPLDGDVLYAYAGFLFNTMGGQAYLRRRSPRVEALSCFYALQVIDAAQQRGYNPAGIDPREEIERCSALLGAQPLVFAEEYRANLEELSLRWEK